jgi:hypothetical protein
VYSIVTSYVYKSVPANEKVLLKGKKEKVLLFLFIASEIWDDAGLSRRVASF